MSDRPTLLASVDRTVEALPKSDADAAVVHLAQLLAREIDERQAVARAAARALRAALDADDEALVEQVESLRAKLGEREALDRLGARLASVLVELQATPRARGKAAGAAGGRLTRLRATS